MYQSEFSVSFDRLIINCPNYGSSAPSINQMKNNRNLMFRSNLTFFSLKKFSLIIWRFMSISTDNTVSKYLFILIIDLWTYLLIILYLNINSRGVLCHFSACFLTLFLLILLKVCFKVFFLNVVSTEPFSDYMLFLISRINPFFIEERNIFQADHSNLKHFK